MSMCRVFSCVIRRGCLLGPVCSLGKTLLAFALLLSVLQGQICLLLQVFLTSYFFILVHYNEKKKQKQKHLFCVLVLEGLVGLYRTVQLQLLQHYCLGHRLGLQWYWMVCLETNRDHSVIFKTSSKYCISDSFVNHDGYSISSKGFWPTVVDIMIIWVKFARSGPFEFADS